MDGYFSSQQNSPISSRSRNSQRYDLSIENIVSLGRYLQSSGYYWFPLTPDQLQNLPKEGSHESWERIFWGWGWERWEQKFFNFINQTDFNFFLENLGDVDVFKASIRARLGFSSLGDRIYAHHRWTPMSSRDHVYLGRETYLMSKKLEDYLDDFENKSVLDMGTGSGVLLIQLLLSMNQSGLKTPVKSVGFDLNLKCLEFAQANACLHGLDRSKNLFWLQGDVRKDLNLGFYDGIIMNPPMVAGSAGRCLYNEGGPTGTEIFHLFLLQSHRVLKKHGCVYVIIPLPRDYSWKTIRSSWTIVANELLERSYNSKLYHECIDVKEKEYDLYFMKLRKN